MPAITGDMGQADAAHALAAAGIYVFPADHPGLDQCAGIGPTHNPWHANDRGKHPAVKWDSGASTSEHNIDWWWRDEPRNVGIHCGKSGLLVVDEDAAGEFDRFAADHGVEIPETYTVTTAKGKHYYFDDTEGGALGIHEGAFGSYAINIRSGVGYVVGPSSLHESGVVYAANDVRTIAPLPSWIPDAIRGGKPPANGTPTAAEVLNSDPFGTYQRFVLPDVIKANHRHSTIVQYAGSLLARDCPLDEAKILIKDAWQRCEQPPDARAYTLDLAYADLEDIYQRYPAGRSEGYQKTSAPTSPSLPAPLGLTLPTSFYDARPELTEIRHRAHQRDADADPVLYATLARINAMAPHTLRIDTGVLEPAALNLFVAACGPSGAGKTSAAGVSKRLYQSSLLDFKDGLPLGSGEGIVETFFAYVWEDDLSREPKKDGTRYQVRVKRQEYHNAFLVADEGQAMLKMMDRSGSVLAETIRSLWVGTTAGQNNASAETRRILPEGSYALGMLVGFQPDTIQPLLADGAGGTPQRFVYCWVVDDTIPDQVSSMAIPSRVFSTRATTLQMAQDIKDEIRAIRRARRRGAQFDRLDAHDYLTKAKLAAGLCLLGGRTVIDEEDWELAGIMWETSCRVRDEMVSYGKSLSAQAAHEKNVARAVGEGMAETARQEARERHGAPWRVAKNIANKVHDGGLRTVGAVNRKLARRDQNDHDLLASAWAIAVDEGWVAVSGDGVEPGQQRPT
jgi:hypothetical protein